MIRPWPILVCALVVCAFMLGPIHPARAYEDPDSIVGRDTIGAATVGLQHKNIFGTVYPITISGPVQIFNITARVYADGGPPNNINFSYAVYNASNWNLLGSTIFSINTVTAGGIWASRATNIRVNASGNLYLCVQSSFSGSADILDLAVDVAAPVNAYNFTQASNGWPSVIAPSFYAAQNVSIFANYTAFPYSTINGSSSPISNANMIIDGIGNVCPFSANLTNNETHTFAADAYSGYVFSNWLINGTSFLPNPISLNFSGNTNITAFYVQQTTISGPGNTLLWQYLLAGDFVGWIFACYVVILGQIFYALIPTLIGAALYIRLKNLAVLGVIWILVGAIMIPAFPIVSPLAIFLLVIGGATVLYKLFQHTT